MTKRLISRQLFGLLGLLSISVLGGTALGAGTTEEAANAGAYDSPLSGGMDFQFVPVRFPKYQWAEGMVDPKSGEGIRFSLEWLPFPQIYGKLGVGLSSGFYQIKDLAMDADYSTSVYAIPVEGYLSYRFDYIRNQLLVPLLKVGTSAVFAQQHFRPGTPLPTYTYHGLDYGAGIELCLNPIDYQASRSLDTSTGINATFLVFEFARSQQLNTASLNAPNLSRDELRFGLRFEM